MAPIVALAMLTLDAAYARDLHVGPGQEYPQLQGAVDDAANGQRVVVHPGTYGPVTVGRTVEIVGAEGAAVTVIEGRGSAAVEVTGNAPTLRGLTLDGLGSERALVVENADATVEDAVLTGGYSPSDGGCVWTDDSVLVLRRTTIVGCTADSDGGGLWASESDLTLDAVTVSANVAPSGSGGGVYLDEVQLVALGALFADNLADDPNAIESDGFGGGIYADDGSSLLVVGGRFERNAARSVRTVGGLGGAMRIKDSSAFVDSTVFDANVATERGSAVAGRTAVTLTIASSLLTANEVDDPATGNYGGALFCEEDSQCVVDRAWFERNIAEDGGAIASLSEIAVRTSMFCANQANDDAGAIDLGNLDVGIPASVSGNVFSSNTAADEGGAVVTLDASSVSVVNNHFVANTANDAGAVSMLVDGGAPALSLINNLYGSNVGIDNGSAALELNAGSPLVEDYEWFFDNVPDDIDAVEGLHTTLGLDPQLAGAVATCDVDELIPQDGSPLHDGGDPLILDADLTVSDIGAFGGPDGDASEFLDRDGDGWAGMIDCDDGDNSVRFDAIEVCNGIDDDCDSLVDAADTTPDAEWLHPDVDGDGLGDPAAGGFFCRGDGLVADASDCDDADATVLGGSPMFVDADGDGFGSTGAVIACSDGPHTSVDDTDCDDLNPAVGPPRSWYEDGDGDGHGAGGVVDGCDPPDAGWVNVGDDCDDTVGQTFPGAAEQCNDTDDDCDGLVDDDVVFVDWWPDADFDAYGDASAVPVRDCLAPGADWASTTGDCNDGDPGVNPGESEVCGGADEDCDTLLDDQDPSLDPASLVSWYVDVDRDGYGDGTTPPVVACDGPDGTVADGTDCNDGAPGTHPNAVEVPYDGIDQDCDGADAEIPVDQDTDGDGITDLVEDWLGTDPADPDTDDDGLSDGEEGATDTDGDGLIDPLDPDDDDDGFPTLDEIPGDTDEDGVPNRLDPDSDGDGVVDGVDPAVDDDGGRSGAAGEPQYCGCGTGGAGGGGFGLLVLALTSRRRRMGLRR